MAGPQYLDTVTGSQYLETVGAGGVLGMLWLAEPQVYDGDFGGNLLDFKAKDQAKLTAAQFAK